MSKICLKLNHLSKDYGNNKGVFDLNLELSSGNIISFVGGPLF